VSNATRGVLAEYIVGLALRCIDGRARAEWDASDLRTQEGDSVESKSAAYVQTWKQWKLSNRVQHHPRQWVECSNQHSLDRTETAGPMYMYLPF
jgi:hypothetical protein